MFNVSLGLIALYRTNSFFVYGQFNQKSNLQNNNKFVTCTSHANQTSPISPLPVFIMRFAFRSFCMILSNIPLIKLLLLFVLYNLETSIYSLKETFTGMDWNSRISVMAIIMINTSMKAILSISQLVVASSTSFLYSS